MNSGTPASRNMEALKIFGIFGAILVYALAVIYGDIMFITLMAKVFPAGFLGTMAIIGALTTAASCLLLPLAKWQWFRNGPQMIWSWIFWAIEFAVLGMNSILAAAVATGQPIDSYLNMWLQVCPTTPLICALGWGICFFLDESSKRVHQALEVEDRAHDLFAKEYEKAVNSEEVYAILTSGAQAAARAYVEAMLHSRTVFAQLPKFSSNRNGSPPKARVYPAVVRDVAVREPVSPKDEREP